MSGLSRRAFLLSSASVATIAVAPAMPNSSVVASAGIIKGHDLMAFAVGTPGEYDWQAIHAGTPEEAFREWVWSRWGNDENAPEFDPDFVNRVEQWDKLDEVRPADWFAADLGHCCERCGYETHPEIGGRVVAGEVVCEECLTVEDKIAADPEGMFDELADRIADEGEDEVRAWLETHGAWPLPGDLWARVVKAGMLA